MADPFAALGVLALVFLVLGALAVGVALRVRSRRREGWRLLAERRGLRHDTGDPLGLGELLRSRVELSLSGTVDGIDVLLLGEEVPRGDGPDPLTPVALVRADGVDVSRVVLDRRLTRLRCPRHGDLLVLRPGPAFRGTGSTATAAEAERLLEELLRRVRG